MSTWTEFYNQIRDPSWPDCDQESDFDHLPEAIRMECQNRFGYVPGSFRKQSKLVNKRFQRSFFDAHFPNNVYGWNTAFRDEPIHAAARD